MSYYEDEEREEQEPREVPTLLLDDPAPCWICNRPGRRYACFRCGKAVCYNPTNYFGASPCGGWILDTWHNDHPEGNEFYCRMCLAAGLVPEEGVSAAGLTFKMVPDDVFDHLLEVYVKGQRYTLGQDETRTLIAYLYDQRGELFGKLYDPEAQESEPVAASVGAGDIDLGSLDDHPF